MYPIALSIVLFLLANIAEASNSTLKPCNTHDQSQLDQCVLTNFEDSMHLLVGGVPKLGIPSIDPLDIKKIVIKRNNKQMGYELVLTDCRFFGISNSKYIKARTDLKARHIELDIDIDKGLSMVGNYNISGKVLLLPVTGNGNINVNLTNMKSKFRFDYDLKNKKGKEYIDIKDVTITNTFDKGHIHLDNLFNGNKLLGDNMNQVFNDNWQELSKDLVPVISKAMSSIFKKILSAFLNEEPYDFIFPN